MSSSPEVTPFFHSDSNTWTYLVADSASGAAVVIDPVLDFDPKAGRTGTRSAKTVLDVVQAKAYRLEWILETHAHADHLSAGAGLRRQVPGARLGIGEGTRTVQATFKPIFNLG